MRLSGLGFTGEYAWVARGFAPKGFVPGVFWVGASDGNICGCFELDAMGWGWDMVGAEKILEEVGREMGSLVDLGNDGKEASGDGGGNTNSLGSVNMGDCEQEANSSSVLVILAIVSLEGGGGEGGGIAIISKLRDGRLRFGECLLGTSFLAGDSIDFRREIFAVMRLTGVFVLRRSLLSFDDDATG
jgi:hypothetical protein